MPLAGIGSIIQAFRYWLTSILLVPIDVACPESKLHCGANHWKQLRGHSVRGFYKHSGADAGLIGTDQIMGTYLSHFLAFLNRSGSFPVVSSFQVTRSKCLFACKGRTSTSASCADAINMLCIDFFMLGG